MQKIQKSLWGSWKHLIFALMAVFCLAGVLPSWVSAAETQTDTQIRLISGEDVYITGFLSETPEQQLHWKTSASSAEEPVFCLPACADSQTVQIYFQKQEMDAATEKKKYTAETGYVMIGGKQVFSGETIELPSAGEMLVIGFADGVEQRVEIKKSANIPAMFINTASGSMETIDADKANKEAGQMQIICADGTVDYQGKLKHIKGRGNATWLCPKKPYNIKLEKSADILGMGKSKGWCLLANYMDASMLRNTVIYNLADETGIPFTMACKPVDFYANGEYLGNYLVTEKVGIESNRVDITDLGKATEGVNAPDMELEDYPAKEVSNTDGSSRKWREIPNDPEDITGGYLIELERPDRYEGEACGFVTTREQPVTLKDPEFISKAQVDYIAEFYQDMEDAIYSETGYNSKGKHFTDYIDEASIAKMYLIQEFSMNIDSGITSFYLYKDSDLTGDGKLHMAPVWDFDMALGSLDRSWGNAEGIEVPLNNPRVWWANTSGFYWNEHGYLNLQAQGVRHESVKKLVVEHWNEVFRPALRILLGEETEYEPKQLRTLREYAEEISASADMNFAIWPEALNDNLTGVTGNDFASSVAYIQNFMTSREEFMNTAFTYGAADGYERLTGTVAIEGTMKVGETLTAEVSDSNGQKFTYQWMADGEKIAGAVEASYVLTEAEAGKEISVAVRDENGTYLADIRATAPEKVPGVDPAPEKPDPSGPDPEKPNPSETDPDKKEPEKQEPGNQNNSTSENPGKEEQPGVKAPVKLAASAVTKVKSTKNGVKIQFTKVENAASYEIYRKAGSTYTKLGSTKALSYTDKEPVGGKKVFYAVRAISGDAAKYTDADYGTEKEIQLPKAPQKVKAKAQKGRKVLLSWKKVKGASAYLIYRADSKKGTYKLVGKVKKANTVKFTDSKKLKKGRKYYYKVAVLQKGKYSPLGKAVKISVRE